MELVVSCLTCTLFTVVYNTLYDNLLYYVLQHEVEAKMQHDNFARKQSVSVCVIIICTFI